MQNSNMCGGSPQTAPEKTDVVKSVGTSGTESQCAEGENPAENAIAPGVIEVIEKKDGLEKLTKKEADELENHEKTIAKHEAEFWNSALALREIQGKRLYKATCKDFGVYCATRWQFERAHGDRLAKAAGVYLDLKLLQMEEVPLPATEAQVRPLTRLSPDNYEAAWRAAVTKANGEPITMKIVREAVAAFLPDRGGKDGGGAATPAAVDAPAKEPEANEPETREVELRKLLKRLRELLQDCDDGDVRDAVLELYAYCGLEADGGPVKE